MERSFRVRLRSATSTTLRAATWAYSITAVLTPCCPGSTCLRLTVSPVPLVSMRLPSGSISMRTIGSNLRAQCRSRPPTPKIHLRSTSRNKRQLRLWPLKARRVEPTGGTMTVPSQVLGGAGSAGLPTCRVSFGARAYAKAIIAKALRVPLGVAMLSRPTTLSGWNLTPLRSVQLARRRGWSSMRRRKKRPSPLDGSALHAAA